MIRPFQSSSNRCAAFTRLESAVVLVTVCAWCLLFVGAWRYHRANPEKSLWTEDPGRQPDPEPNAPSGSPAMNLPAVPDAADGDDAK